LIIIPFIIISLIEIFNHEPWRDEGQAWLIARDSNTLMDLFNSMRYESSPALWHLLLTPLAKIGLPYFTMALTHFLIIFLSVLLVIHFSPFTQLQKGTLIFGYYFLYEYNVIARSYVLTALFLFLIAAYYQERFQKPKLYGSLLILLANSNVHSLVISIVLGSAFLYEMYEQKERSSTPKFYIPIIIIFFGLLLAFLQILPPYDFSPGLSGWNLNITRFKELEKAIIGTFFPIQGTKWNTLLFTNTINFLFLLAFIPLMFSLLFFLRKPFPMSIYILSMVGLFAIFFTKSGKGFRHYGLVFLLFIFCLWIATYYSDDLLSRKDLLAIPVIFSLMGLVITFLTYIILVKSFLFADIINAIRFGLLSSCFFFGLGVVLRKKLLEIVQIHFGFKLNLDLKNTSINQKVFFSKALSVMLIFHIIGSAIAFSYEINHDFSAGKDVAYYIMNNEMLNNNTFIAIYPSPPATSILPHISHIYKQFYFIEYMEFRSFMIWNQKYYNSSSLSIEEIMIRINTAVENTTYTNIILILNKKVNNPTFNEKYSLLAGFEETLVPSESFYIYSLIN